MSNASLPLIPKHDWKFRTKCWVKIDNIHTQKWALWIINNLTKKNVELLKGIMPITIQQCGWLDEHTAGLLSIVVEDRQSALIKAVDKGECGEIYKYPSFTKKIEREHVGAAICELVSQGYADDFKKLVETN